MGTKYAKTMNNFRVTQRNCRDGRRAPCVDAAVEGRHVELRCPEKAK